MPVHQCARVITLTHLNQRLGLVCAAGPPVMLSEDQRQRSETLQVEPHHISETHSITNPKLSSVIYVYIYIYVHIHIYAHVYIHIDI